MKGLNTLLLNEATMQEAVQEWLERRVVKASECPEVRGVKLVSSSPCREFEISLWGRDTEEPNG